MTVPRPPLPYRPCVGIILFNRERKVFVARRIDTLAEAWQMPQGGIDEGENPEQAVFRELREEIGTDRARIIGESREWLSYELPDALIGKLWGGKFCGQEQKWFAMDFEGSDADINLQTEHPEFLEWKWVDFAEVPNLIVPFKRKLYEQLVAEFRHLAG